MHVSVQSKAKVKLRETLEAQKLPGESAHTYSICDKLFWSCNRYVLVVCERAETLLSDHIKVTAKTFPRSILLASSVQRPQPPDGQRAKYNLCLRETKAAYRRRRS